MQSVLNNFSQYTDCILLFGPSLTLNLAKFNVPLHEIPCPNHAKTCHTTCIHSVLHTCAKNVELLRKHSTNTLQARGSREQDVVPKNSSTNRNPYLSHVKKVLTNKEGCSCWFPPVQSAMYAVC